MGEGVFKWVEVVVGIVRRHGYRDDAERLFKFVDNALWLGARLPWSGCYAYGHMFTIVVLPP